MQRAARGAHRRARSLAAQETLRSHSPIVSSPCLRESTLCVVKPPPETVCRQTKTRRSPPHANCSPRLPYFPHCRCSPPRRARGCQAGARRDGLVPLPVRAPRRAARAACSAAPRCALALTLVASFPRALSGAASSTLSLVRSSAGVIGWSSRACAPPRAAAGAPRPTARRARLASAPSVPPQATRAWASRACCCSLPTSASSRCTT